MPPRTRAQGESKQGLIITLVFFILATICLGVAAYFGFSEQSAYEKKAAEAKKGEETFKAERDYYKAAYMMARGYMGMTEGMEGAETLGTLKEQLDRGSLGKNSKDNADVQKWLKTLEGSYGWNGNQPQKTLDNTIKTLTTQNQNLTNQMSKADAERKTAKADLQKKDEELQAAHKDFETKLADFMKKSKEEFDKSISDLADLRAEIKRRSDELDKLKEQGQEEKKATDGTIARKEREIADLKNLVKRKQDEMDQFKLKNPEAPPNMRTDWKIVQMDARGTHPYINLGSADHVRPQLTFSIYGVSSDGRPYPQPKGTLEVVSVIAPHLSQARITSVKDRNRDPIVERDVIYNASWNPNIKKHIAVAGIVDLTGDGRDSLMEFMRNLERQNIVVDAYEDPKDGSMKGQITYQTDFLILGGLPDRSSSGRQGESEKRIVEGRNHMQEEAKKYGVPVKNLVSYLEMIGYPLPHTVRQGGPSRTDTEYRSDIVPRLGRDKLVPKNPVKEQPQEVTPPNK